MKSVIRYILTILAAVLCTVISQFSETWLGLIAFSIFAVGIFVGILFGYEDK